MKKIQKVALFIVIMFRYGLCHFTQISSKGKETVDLVASLIIFSLLWEGG